ncbi:hypothetical protein AW169_11020 [Corynebacterium stationis]|nr:hypothetical protein AW169_11020 [Corynebacterium stationis]
MPPRQVWRGESADLVISEALLAMQGEKTRVPSSLRLHEFRVWAAGTPFMDWGSSRKIYPKILKPRSAKD